MPKEKMREEKGMIPMGGVLLSPKTGIPISMGGALHAADVVNGEEDGDRTGSAWQDLPKGWTPASRAKFAKSLTGMSSEAKEIAKSLTQETMAAQEAGDDPLPGFVDKCMDRIDGHVDDPGAFCAALKDRITGTTHWRGKGK
jgi:hypothetical protein